VEEAQRAASECERLRHEHSVLVTRPHTGSVYAFAVHGPMVWNSLPDDFRAQQDYESYRRGLKTWLFSRYQRVQRITDFRDNSAI